MIKVTCRLETVGDKATPSILINNHWNNDNYVEIEIDGKKFTVIADEMITAIQNCTRVANFKV